MDIEIDGMIISDNKLVQYIGNADTVVIPDYVTEIAEKVFEDNDELTHLIIGKNVKIIPRSMCWGCVNLKSVILGESVTEISKSAFCWCETLTDIKLSNKLEIIGMQAFSRCYNLQNFQFPMSLKHIGHSAFTHSGIHHNIILPEGLESIGDTAFSSTNSQLIYIPNSVTSIGENILYLSDITYVISSNPLVHINKMRKYNSEKLTTLINKFVDEKNIVHNVLDDDVMNNILGITYENEE